MSVAKAPRSLRSPIGFETAIDRFDIGTTGKVSVAARNRIFHARLAVCFVVVEVSVQQLAGPAGDVQRACGNINIRGDGLRALQAHALRLVLHRARIASVPCRKTQNDRCRA